MSRTNDQVLLIVLLCFVLTGIGQTEELATNVRSTIPGLESPNLISKTHDLSAAIAAHVQGSPRPNDLAKADAIAELFWVPREQPLVTRTETSAGQFLVMAPEWFHEHLAGMAKWMAGGEKQITIEARIVTVSEEMLRGLHLQFGAAWEMATNQESQATLQSIGRDFGLKPTAPLADAPRLIGPDFSRQSHIEFGVQQPTAAMNVQQYLPCRIARASSKQVKSLVNRAQADIRSNVLQAPKVTIFSGQRAVVKDTTSRPFVTSVKPVEGDSGAAMQPVITVLEDGLRLQLRAEVVGENQIQMDSNVIFGEIGNVDEFTFEAPGHIGGTTVQIPEYIQRSVEVSKRLRNGQSLVIDPHFVSKKVTKRRFRSDVVTREYTIVILTPSVFKTNTIEVDGDGNAKVAKL